MDKIIKVLFCGDVDSGKSTLVGRILADTGNIKDDQMKDAETASAKYSDRFEYAMLLDGLKDEREQNITIDVAHRYMDYNNCRIHIFDCPGHVQYTKNMAVAAAQAETAVIVIDVTKKTVTGQTENHINICRMFGIKNIVFAVNKMDAVGWSEKAYDVLKEKLNGYSGYTVPVSGLDGTNIFKTAGNIFYNGKSVFDYITSFEKNIPVKSVFSANIISVLKHNNKRYYYAYADYPDIPVPGRITVYPSGVSPDINIESYDGFNFVFSTDKETGINRGDRIFEYGAAVNMSCRIKSQILFLNRYEKEHQLILKNGTKTVMINNISDGELFLGEPLAVPEYKKSFNNTGIIIDYKTKKTIGVALLQQAVSDSDKKGKIFWLTGLSCSGKTAIAKEIIKQSVIKPVLLDADELRSSAFSDLKYDLNSRTENNRRTGELAMLIAGQGFNVVVACISPFKNLRDEFKNKFGNNFKEIYVSTSLEICKKRDVKGLYKTSRQMVGVDFEYEKPDNPDYIADTENKSAADIASEIIKL